MQEALIPVVLLLGACLIPHITAETSLVRGGWPALLALVVIFFTKRAALGLFLGGLSGCLILNSGHPLTALNDWLLDHAWPSLFGNWALGDPLLSLPSQWHLWHVGAITFTLLLGSFAAVLERGGGLRQILIGSRGHDTPHPKRRFLTRVYTMGILCFFDGLANSLMVGRISRGVADQVRVPRAALAYLVDTTSSAVACVAFLSTWIAIQLTLIQEGLAELSVDQSAYLVFLSSIPRNYYCLFALVLAFLVARRGWWVGPMSREKASPSALAGETTDSNKKQDASLSSALVPIATLLLAILLLYYFLHPLYPPSDGTLPPRFPVTVDAIQQALGSNAGPAAFVLGSLLALLVAALLYPSSRRAELPATIFTGIRQLAGPLIVLFCAWVFGSVMKSLGTAAMIADLLEDTVSFRYFPFVVFGFSCLISFTTGSSWGTMSLLTPLFLPSLGPLSEAQNISPELLGATIPSVVAAIFGGAVFGDHCSPFSDTTIISSLACGISTPQHTITQLPYALLTAGLTLSFGYLLEGVGLPPWIGLLLGLAALCLITTISPRKTDSPQPTCPK